MAISSKSVCVPSGGSPSQGFRPRLLPGRRRLMRNEDSSGTDSDEEGMDAVAPPPSVSDSPALGSKRSTPGDKGEGSFPPRKKTCVSQSPSVRAPLDSGESDSDVMYVRTERVPLSQTFLTSWLVRKV